MSDGQVAERLFDQGRRAIHRNDVDSLQAACNQLASLLPPDEQEKADKIMQTVVSSGGQRNIYIESYIPGGYHLEIAERNDRTFRAFEMMKTAAANWDGTRPVRDISDLFDGQ